MRKTTLSLVAACVLFVAFATTPASAGPVTLNCPGGLQDISASNPEVTFGGSGIPTTSVCTQVFGDVMMVLTATQRFSNPAVTDNGIDTYSAGAGDDGAQGQPNYGIWNFDFYAYNQGTSTTYMLDLGWDADAGFGTDTSQMGHFLQALAPGQTIQDSWNLGMGFIDTGVAIPGIYSPTAGLFDPNASGWYSFFLDLYGPQAGLLGHLGMDVKVGDVAAVPEPATLLLLGTGIVGLARRRSRKLGQ